MWCDNDENIMKVINNDGNNDMAIQWRKAWMIFSSIHYE